MNIYVLTRSEADHGLSPKIVEPFFSEDRAKTAMMKDLKDYCEAHGIHAEYKVGFESNDVTIEAYTARTYEPYAVWEIACCEVDEQEQVAEDMVKIMHQRYEFNTKYDQIIRDMVEMWNMDTIKSYNDLVDFAEECVLGETIYELAVQNLGGKYDEKSHFTIVAYIQSPRFVSEQESKVNDDILSLPRDQRWLNIMLSLANGEKETIASVRECIDKNLPEKQKLFTKERVKDLIEAHKDVSKNHRKLSSRLNDEEYLAMMDMVLSYKPNLLVTEDKTYTIALCANLYKIARCVFYEAIKQMGWDEIDEHYGHLLKLEKNDNDDYDLVFNYAYDAEDLTEGIEQMKTDYDLYDRVRLIIEGDLKG